MGNVEQTWQNEGSKKLGMTVDSSSEIQAFYRSQSIVQSKIYHLPFRLDTWRKVAPARQPTSRSQSQPLGSAHDTSILLVSPPRPQELPSPTHDRTTLDIEESRCRTPTPAKSKAEFPLPPSQPPSHSLLFAPPIPKPTPTNKNPPPRQNSTLLQSLSAKSSALRNITDQIHTHASTSHEIIDNTSESFSNMSTSIRGSAGRLTRSARQGDRVAVLKLAGIIVVSAILAWWVGGWIFGLLFGKGV